MIQVLRDGELLPVSRDRVLPERLVRPDGPVAEEFVASFIQPELGQTLFELVARRLAETSTLHSEKELTAGARAGAPGDRVARLLRHLPPGPAARREGPD